MDNVISFAKYHEQHKKDHPPARSDYQDEPAEVVMFPIANVVRIRNNDEFQAYGASWFSYTQTTYYDPNVTDDLDGR